MKKKTLKEYIDSRKNMQIKGKVCDLGDVEIAKPKAKEDPHNNKSKPKPSVKEGAQVTGNNDKPVVPKSNLATSTFDKPVNKPKTNYETGEVMQYVKEYLDNKGKLLTNPQDTLDYNGPTPTAPPASATSGKNWKSEPNVGSVAPYKTPENKGPAKSEKGLGELGDEGLKLKPEQPGKSKFVTGGTTGVQSWDENFSRKIKNMNPTQLNEFLQKEVGNLSEAIPATKLIVQKAKENNRVLENLVLELKRNKLIDGLFRELTKSEEYTESLRRVLQSNTRLLSKLESVSPPFGDGSSVDDEDLPSEEDDENPDPDSEESDFDDESDEEDSEDADDDDESGHDEFGDGDDDFSDDSDDEEESDSDDEENQHGDEFQPHRGRPLEDSDDDDFGN